jgi:hypothetical protein
MNRDRYAVPNHQYLTTDQHYVTSQTSRDLYDELMQRGVFVFLNFTERNADRAFSYTLTFSQYHVFIIFLISI